MAGIDKTYIDGREYKFYRNWWIENYEKMVKQFGYAIYLYPFCQFYPNEPEEMTPEFLTNNNLDLKDCEGRDTFAVWNTTEKQDMWLVENCNIHSFRERMLECYSPKWKEFKGKSWAQRNKKPKTVK